MKRYLNLIELHQLYNLNKLVDSSHKFDEHNDLTTLIFHEQMNQIFSKIEIFLTFSDSIMASILISFEFTAIEFYRFENNTIFVESYSYLYNNYDVFLLK